MSGPISDQKTPGVSGETSPQGAGETSFKDRKVSIGERFKEWLCSITFLNLGKFFSKVLNSRKAEVVNHKTSIKVHLTSLVDNAKKEILNL